MSQVSAPRAVPEPDPLQAFRPADGSGAVAAATDPLQPFRPADNGWATARPNSAESRASTLFCCSSVEDGQRAAPIPSGSAALAPGLPPPIHATLAGVPPGQWPKSPTDCAVFIAAEMQQLDRKLQAWLDQVGARLDGFAEHLKGPNLPHNMVAGPLGHQAVVEEEIVQFLESEAKQFEPGYQQELKEAKETKEVRISEPPDDEAPEGNGRHHRGSIKHENHSMDYIKQMMTVRSEHMRPELRNFCSRLLMHPHFDSIVCVFVALSAILVGAEVQYTAATFKDSHVGLDVMEYICTTFFTFELIVRIHGFGPRKVCESNMRKWFTFDAFLVVMPWLDKIMSVVLGGLKPSSGQMSLSKILKVVKISKVLRLVRVMRFCGDLRVMAMMIIGSLQSLFWLMCLLLMLLYVVAIVLTQGATEYLREGDGEFMETMDAQFGTLWLSMYTLFKCMCGGVSWGESADPLLTISFLYWVVFAVYIFFALFSFVNIVTGVFVDSAIQTAERDRSIVVEKQRKAKEALIKNLLVVLEEIDTDSSGTLTLQELMTAFKNEHLANFFSHLNIDSRDMQQLMYLLDQDGNGSIDIVEFVDGLQSCCGAARSFDISILLKQTGRMTSLMVEVIKGMQANVQVPRELTVPQDRKVKRNLLEAENLLESEE